MQRYVKEHRTRVADFWDNVLMKWRADPHMHDLPEVLRRWRRSYDGEVDLGGYPEAFIGDLRGEKHEPRLVVLGLNPAVASSELVGPDGVFTQAAREHTYSRSSEYRLPFENEDWTRVHRRDNPYWVKLVKFAKRLLGNDAGVADILSMEMFPFRSQEKTHPIRPPHEFINNYVWAPLREMEAEVIFAFGADWQRVCTDLLGRPLACHGPFEGQRDLRDPTRGKWQLETYSLGTKRVVVSWQLGTANPPGEKRIPELQRVVDEALSIQQPDG